MDFQTKKFWVFVGIAAVCMVGMVIGKIEFMQGLEWIVASAGAWGILDTTAKFANKKEKVQ